MDNNMEERLLNSEADNTRNLKGRIWEESKKIWRVSFPAILTRVTTFGMLVVTQSFVGHISQIDLAGYALTQTVIIRFANGIVIALGYIHNWEYISYETELSIGSAWELGLSSATETLCGQAFGAKHFHMMGIYLQRSWIVDLFVATVLLPCFIFGNRIFKLLGQEDDIAMAAGTFSLWFIPTLYFFVFGMTIQMYLQSQLKNMIIGWLSSFSFALHLLLSWIFVIKLNLGIPGAMGSMVLSSWLQIIGLFVYIFGGWCPQTWRGFSKAAFSDLLPVVKLSVSSGVMLCLELWYNAIILLVAGYLKNASTAISAFSICLNINAWEFMIMLGFLTGSCVRVSNELGRGDAKAAKFSIKVILSTSVSIGVIFWILCLFFGREIAYLFTSDEEVVDMVSSLSVFLAFSILLNSVQPVLSGVAVGAGWQSVVAYVNIGCYYVIGIPLGVVLAFVADLSVRGMWIGMLCGVAVQTLVLLYMTWKTDWDEQVKKASDRLNKWFLKPSEESNQNNLQA